MFQLEGTKVRELCAIIASMRFLWEYRIGFVVASILGIFPALAGAQAMPATAGETLSGKRLVLAEAVRGHAAVLIFGFGREASDGCTAWAKALRADPAMAGALVYESAMLEAAPGFVRGMIQGSMRKGMSLEAQDRFVVFTQDEKLWRAYFGVASEKEPYVVFLDASGKVLWHGHGDAGALEALLRKAKP